MRVTVALSNKDSVIYADEQRCNSTVRITLSEITLHGSWFFSDLCQAPRDVMRVKLERGDGARVTSDE